MNGYVANTLQSSFAFPALGRLKKDEILFVFCLAMSHILSLSSGARVSVSKNLYFQKVYRDSYFNLTGIIICLMRAFACVPVCRLYIAG
jgi:hypothetical protein